jgi:hypothetical protein
MDPQHWQKLLPKSNFRKILRTFRENFWSGLFPKYLPKMVAKNCDISNLAHCRFNTTYEIPSFFLYQKCVHDGVFRLESEWRATIRMFQRSWRMLRKKHVLLMREALLDTWTSWRTFLFTPTDAGLKLGGGRAQGRGGIQYKNIFFFFSQPLLQSVVIVCLFGTPSTHTPFTAHTLFTE